MQVEERRMADVSIAISYNVHVIAIRAIACVLNEQFDVRFDADVNQSINLCLHEQNTGP